MTLRTRKPTGRVAYPMVLVEGEEKAGKTYAALSLSADQRVGRTFAFDLGEGTVDEYAALGRYEVVDHNGSFSDLLDKVRLACAEPRQDDKPNVIVIDSMTFVWEAIKDGLRSRARNSRSGRKQLAQDPDADVSITIDLWNDGKSRWGQLVHTLRTWDGIAVLIAHGHDVVAMKDGRPDARADRDYSVEVEKNLPKTVTAWVRMTRPHTARLVGVRSLNAPELGRDGLLLPDAPLAHVVFDILGAGAEFGPSSVTEARPEQDSATAKHALIDLLAELGRSDPTKDAAAVWRSVLPGDPKHVTDDEWARLEAAARDLGEAK